MTARSSNLPSCCQCLDCTIRLWILSSINLLLRRESRRCWLIVLFIAKWTIWNKMAITKVLSMIAWFSLRWEKGLVENWDWWAQAVLLSSQKLTPSWWPSCAAHSSKATARPKVQPVSSTATSMIPSKVGSHKSPKQSRWKLATFPKCTIQPTTKTKKVINHPAVNCGSEVLTFFWVTTSNQT